PDVLCFLPLAAGGDVELDVLALAQRLVAGALDVGVVHENVVASIARDEAVTLLRVEELDRTCRRQLILFSSLIVRTRPLTRRVTGYRFCAASLGSRGPGVPPSNSVDHTFAAVGVDVPRTSGRRITGN